MKAAQLVGVLVCVTAMGFGPAAAPAQTPGTAAALPPDVHADSWNRLSLITREQLDAEDQETYDYNTRPGTPSLAGLHGPGGIRLHGSKARDREKLVSPRLQELVRLVLSREMDQPYEWTTHEDVALKAGLSPAVIDVIRNRAPLTGVPESDAALIQWGRELIRTHKVTSATYARALKAVGEKTLVDLTVLMGDYAETAVLLTVFDVQLGDRRRLLPLAEPAPGMNFPKDVFAESRNRLPLVQRAALDPEHQKLFDAQVAGRANAAGALQGPGGLRLRGSLPDKLGEGLGRRLQELIRLAVSREWDQGAEWTLHEPVARKMGLEPAIIEVIRDRKPLTGVPEKEAAMIQLVRDLFGTHKVSPAVFARGQKALGTRDLVDMCVLMGDYTETAFLLTTFDVHLPDRKILLPAT